MERDRCYFKLRKGSLWQKSSLSQSMWLWLIGSGFIAYGIYMFVSTKYRRYVIR